MKKLFKKIINAIKNFFKEWQIKKQRELLSITARFFKPSQMKEEGGEKIKTNARQVRKLCRNS